jgi:2-(1,2-epoxy-1,2-dihydrophenyl)acetyl-CoA isomerase
VADDLVVETRDRALWLILNRPQRLNAFTWAMRDGLLAALGPPRPDIDAIILTGRGRGFCAGVDRDEVLVGESDSPPEARRAELVRTHEVVQRMRAVPQPVIALVNGVAAGGGWSLALACDFILAADSARFVTAFTQLGLVPDLAGAYNLTRRVGATRAKSIIMRGQTIDASAALAIGAVDAVVGADMLEAQLAGLLPDIVATGKRHA